MRLRAPARLATTATLALSVTAGVVATAPAAHAVGEHSKCTVNWSNGESSTVRKNGWNLRSGPGTGYTSRGYLFRGDPVKLLCSRGSWEYVQLSKTSKSGLPPGTRGWAHRSGLGGLA
ncbi:SH3 domain-containing protein [Streptomyces sp. NBC_01304]|uniref:SH3 domain-containing protein n=1 Tax=Streptomyces sp. NBC_01304 TaxID=2903818 RepID=UPI002E0D1EE3|nr:SH3 domain-containing protein [Streptomyces sp. NBC_01304]